MAFAFFDLDQTLLPYDTQALFCNFVLQREGWRRAYLGLFAAAAPLKAVRLLSTGGLKRVFLSYLWRMPEGRLTALAGEFAATVVPPLLYPEVAAELERHRAAGLTLVLNTASPEFYAAAIARVLRFDHCFGTRVTAGSGRLPLFPEIEGANNKHEVKLARMSHLIAADQPRPLAGSFAYSDSRADLPLLRLAEHRTVVNPDAVLEKTAVAEGWRILRPARPNPTRLQFFTDCALQAAGFWSRRG